MPTVARIGPYRFFFYSSENREPPHIHVEDDEKVAKYWLDPGAVGIESWILLARTDAPAGAHRKASAVVSGGMA
jgi:hypothetical protein